MSARERVLLGQFLRRRLADPDDPEDPLAPGGVMPRENSFLEQNIPADEALARTPPAALPQMPPPPLGSPAILGLGPTPPLSPTSPAGRQPSQDVSLSRPPAGPIPVPEPPHTRPAAQQPHPTTPHTSPAGLQPFQGGGTGPSTLPPPPDFSPDGTEAVPFQPAPNGGPAAQLPDMPAPQGPGRSDPPPMPAPPHRGEYAPGGALPAGRSPLDDLRNADARILEVLRGLGGDKYAESFGFPFGGQGDLALDPSLYVRHVKRLGDQLGRTAVHAATQVALFLQNNKGRIWNPALLAPPPLLINFISPAIDVGLIMTPPQATRDIHREMAEGVYSVDHISAAPPFYESQKNIGAGGGPGVPGLAQLMGSKRLVGAASQDSSIVDNPASVPPFEPIVRAGLSERNRYTEDRPYTENAVSKIGDLVDSVVDGKDSDFLATGPEGLRVSVSTRREPQKLAKLFEQERTKVSSPHGWRPKAGLATSEGAPFTSRLDAAAFPGGIIPAKIKGENDFGFAVSDSGRPSAVDDDDAYVPLSFTDLRPISGLKYRTVYFRPFLTNLSEDFSPQWNKANFYGRADAVATYMSTGRALQLGFVLHAFGPEDVRTIYQKLNWLSSMVYPEYDRDLVMKSGPVVRLRVGDVVDALGPEGTRGLPGIIESLSYDYSDSLWELKKDLKVPVNIKVSVGFTVLHDRPIGRGGLGKFGGIGTVKEGRYIPPALQETGPVQGSRDFLEMEEREGSFRPVGNANEYTLENIVLDDSEK